MILKSGLTSLLALGLCAQAASANCKAPADKYDLVDLGDVVEDQAESRAVAIDKRGRVIVRTEPKGFGQPTAEYLIGTNGNAKPVENPDELAYRETLRLVGTRMRVTDYYLVQEGYLPARATTLIDRRGGEIDVADYCSAPLAGWELKTFVISNDGEQSAGLFESDGGFLVATCKLDDESVSLFETQDEIELAGINNDGAIGGLLKSGDDLFLWRWSDGERVSENVPETLLNLEVSGIDEAGRVFALATGEVVNPLIFLGEDDQLAPALVLPGEGWDVNWAAIGPCGMVIGEATYTNFASFMQLSEEERYRMRENFSEFWQYALERETEQFIWTPSKRIGRFLGAVSKDTRAWRDVKILAINENGVAVGHADNELGQTRAIKLVPSRD